MAYYSPIMATELLTTKQAAERLAVSQQWVQALIGRGELKAEWFGKAYMLRASDVDKYERKPLGRPPTDVRPVKRVNGKKRKVK